MPLVRIILNKEYRIESNLSAYEGLTLEQAVTAEWDRVHETIEEADLFATLNAAKVTIMGVKDDGSISSDAKTFTKEELESSD